MAVLIPEPADINPVTADWQTLLNKVTRVNGGLILVQMAFEEQTVTLKEGSRFEVNGSYFRCDEDETVIISAINAVRYIYAVPGSNGTTVLSASDIPPVFDAAKGGFFNGPNRLLAWVRTDGAGMINLLNAAAFNYLSNDKYYNPLQLTQDNKLVFALKEYNQNVTPQNGDLWIS